MLKLIQALKHKLKWWIAKDELEELHRWRSSTNDYKYYLCEFKDIVLVLENLTIHVNGNRSLNISRPPSTTGPWDINGLRYNIRFKRGGTIPQEPTLKSNR
jgi:hypothetical protein